MERKWSGKTQGGTFGQNCVLFYFKYGSLRLAYLFLYFIIPFYLLFDRKGYNAMYWYSKSCINKERRFHLPFIFKIFYNFGQVFIDRFAVFGNPKNKFTFEYENKEIFDHYLKEESGFLVTSAHIGNFELLSYSIDKIEKRLHPILFGGEAEVFQKLRTTLFKDKNIDPIILNESGNFIFEINCALRDGGIVSLPADRTYGNIKSFTVPFLGHLATFPLGVFHIAVKLNVPILSIFVVKQKYRGYKVYVNEIKVERDLQIKNQTAELLGKAYIEELEKIILKYPDQWYNFYRFWESNDLYSSKKSVS